MTRTTRAGKRTIVRAVLHGGLVFCLVSTVPGVAAAQAVDCLREIDPIYRETDPTASLHAVSPSEIERIRSELIGYIWKAPALPTDLPEVVERVGNPFPDLTLPANLERIDRLTTTIDGFVSRMHLLVPKDARRTFVIVHQGHNDSLAAGNIDRAVLYFLERRHPVLVVHMPLYGGNTGPFIPFSTPHELMTAFETPGTSAMRYFVEPVIRAVNYASRVRLVRRISMVGLSGGGWTTTVAAAVDPRIRVSASVAGSLPTYLRDPRSVCTTVGDRGDFEQNHPPLLAIASYLDLYVLGSYGPRRGHLQVLNQFDTCCFRGVRFRTYLGALRRAIRELPNARYDLFLDATHFGHRISPAALEQAIYPFLHLRRLRSSLRAAAD